MKSRDHDLIQIAGAGPAGLSAAITLAQAGHRVIVHEAFAEVGHRFRQDLQGFENWSETGDALNWLRELGIDTDFETFPCHEGTAFDAWNRDYRIHSKEPLFYMVERGPGPTSLDSAMLRQAQALGVEVRFNSRLDKLDGPGIFALGPKAADAIAVGYHFRTNMENGYWAICDDHLAPKGYAYLLVMNGRGTVKSCIFRGFKDERQYVKRTVERFKKLAGLQMIDPKPHGGVGNFRYPVQTYYGRHPVAGELAGFQDTLWGFGMRYAIHSGVLAARSFLGNPEYDELWRRSMESPIQTAIVNRALYELLGNYGYRWFLRRQGKGDAREFLHRQYAPSRLKKWLVPWARSRITSGRSDKSCDHVECQCVWCRCGPDGSQELAH
ncbi:MAG: NAD(P)/FAD-dependent oxidoreductase [Acidiferrobacterales bacterium]